MVVHIYNPSTLWFVSSNIYIEIQSEFIPKRVDYFKAKMLFLFYVCALALSSFAMSCSSTLISPEVK